MINVKLINHSYKYNITQLLNIFFEEISFDEDIDNCVFYLENQLNVDDELVEVKTRLFKNGSLLDENKIIKKNKSEIDKFLKNYHQRLIKKSIYIILKKYIKPNSKWGILTGMRPVKVVFKYYKLGYNFSEIKDILKNEFLIDDEKIKLITNIAKVEKDFLYPLDKKISIYISIPFCITRCLYCSFPSNIISKKKNKVNRYVKCLIKEMKKVLKVVKQKKLTIDSIYIGGGTPSTLETDQLKELLLFISKNINMDKIEEYTFEAGRPNTINSKKLEILKKYNVSRICLNPQTMNNEILNNINRDHCSKDIIEKYKLIKKYNFNSINMDLIIGLPNQTFEIFKNTLKSIVNLSPDNITIHSLALKRGSKLYNNDYQFDDISVTRKSMDYAKSVLNKTYHPYYMYRQKNIAGNLENIGFCKNNKQSLYNIKIMEEKHTILAFGAGAVSKISYYSTDRFDRVANSKGLEDYMKRIDEMADKKIKKINNVL
ncbi:MAG: coproporphyrinogen dehydrogenase HemZ [Bacillota bacterium]